MPDFPILFNDPQLGLSGPRPVMNCDPCERWIRFVFTTIKQRFPKALHVNWGTPMGPLSYGFASFDRDVCRASVLAIDLARLTTGAAKTAKQLRETCSPFLVASMEEQGLKWVQETPPPTPPVNYTLGQLVEDLRRFGEDYYQADARNREENPMTAKHSWIQLAAQVSAARDSLLAIPGFAELRDWAQSEWNEDISVASSRRVMDVLIQRSNGNLSRSDVEGLSLAETVMVLRESTECWDTVLPEPLKQQLAKRQAQLRPVQPVAYKRDRLHVEDIDSFSKVKDVTTSMVERFLEKGYLDRGEDAIQVALESILGVAFHKEDWGGEGNDLYTANVVVNGARTPTAFMLKGKGLKNRTMEVKHCGKNGDQVMRLFQSPAYLFVIQFVGNISEALIRHVEGEVARSKVAGRAAQFVIMDGQDTARVLHAYGKLSA